MSKFKALYGWVNLFSLIFFTGVLLLYYKKIQYNSLILTIFLSLIFSQFFFIKKNHNSTLFWVTRDFVIPILSLLSVFTSLNYIIPGVNPKDLDYQLIKIDYILFGTYPTVWLERYMHPLVTDIMQLAYTTYYFMPIVLGVALKIHHKNREFSEGLTLILLCFYLSYIGYLLVPAIGPRYTIEHLHNQPLKGMFFYEGISKILNSLEGIKRDAFPSGHTAITLVVLHMAYRYERRLFYVFLVPALLLILSTVYCRYHYVVDVIGGVALYGLTMLLGRYITFLSGFIERR